MLNPEKLLAELIALPSVNPAFLPDQPEWTGEQRVADFLAHQADRAGLELSFQKVFPGRSNLIARLIPAGGRTRQRVLLAPHMDTVGVSDESSFKPRKSGGRLYGRGACDTKGSVSAMFSALLHLAIKGERPQQTEIALLALVDEEHGQNGSWTFSKSKQKADFAIVGEPTLNQVVTAHKGDFWLRLSTKGKAAHGARPELGKNAIHEMARAVDLLETKYARALRKKRHPLLGNPTVNVGHIQGGKQANIVPDECSILIDRRTLPGESEKTVRKELNDLFKSKDLKVVIANNKDNPCPALETDPQLPLVRQLMAGLRQKQPLGVDYFTDAAPLAAGGTPTVVFGPGDIAQAHTANEWISIKSLNLAAEQLKKFLSELP
jgi:acetylornithine deacetylase/succinyl-diaminopimelate desuccinylase-like protein